YLDDDRSVGVGGDVADGALVVLGDQPNAGQVDLLIRVGDDLDDLCGKVEGGSDRPLAGGVVESGAVPPLQGAAGGVTARFDGDHFCPPFAVVAVGVLGGVVVVKQIKAP